LTEQLDEARGTIQELELENDKLELQIKQLSIKKETPLIDSFQSTQIPQMPRYLDRPRFKSTQQTFFTPTGPTTLAVSENKEMTKLLAAKPVSKINIDQQLKDQYAVKGQNLNHLMLAPQRPRFLMSKVVAKEGGERDKAMGVGVRQPNTGEGDSNHRSANEEEVYLQAPERLEQPFELEDYFNAYGEFHSSA